MNGRAYDYNLGRFLSVDPFIQEPGNSQSMNPYSYIMNNPLAGTDPSGYMSQGALGPPGSDEFCASYKCAVVDKVLAGFTMAGDNGASLSQKRDAAEEAKSRSIIGQIESQGGTADVRFWNGGKVKLSELSYVHTAVSAGTDLSRTPNVLKFASNNARDVIRDYVNAAKHVAAASIPYPFGGDPNDPESFGRQLTDVADPISPALDTVDALEDGDYTGAAVGTAMALCRGCKVAGKFVPDPVADAVSKAIQESKKKNIRVEVDGKDFQEQFDDFYKKRRNAKGEVRQPVDPKIGTRQKSTLKEKAGEFLDRVNEVLRDFLQ